MAMHPAGVGDCEWRPRAAQRIAHHPLPPGRHGAQPRPHGGMLRQLQHRLAGEFQNLRRTSPRGNRQQREGK